jgi:hypothetical protein
MHVIDGENAPMNTSLLARPFTRRYLTLGASAGAGAVTLLPRPLFAAQATPMAGMSYPELTVTITDKELTASPADISSGLVLLTVHNQSKSSDSAGLLGPGAGEPMEQLQQAASTPVPGNQFPPFLYSATILGGPGDVRPGMPGQAVIDVPAGTWAVFEEGNLPPAFVTAAAGGATQPEPEATLTVTEIDFAFGGFDKPIPAGKQTWKVVNSGVQPHMLVLSGVPAGTTLAQVLQAASRPDNATPAPGELSEQDLTPVNPAGVILQSPGTTVWPMLDLPAGRYAALCFVPDPRNGEPHAMEGMVAVFDVGATGTPGATPAA